MTLKCLCKIFAAMDTKINLSLMLVVLFLYLSSDASICLGADTISANQSLSRGQTIVSAGGVFELGFFRPGIASNYYLGIWYYQFTPQTVVWVANREKPVSDTVSSELKISGGNLVLFDESKVPIWSTNLNSARSASVQAVLLDSGNLVLREVSSSSKPLWQSFDHLTHTYLPGGKLSYNKTTKRGQILTSWKNSEDPAPGLFSVELNISDNSYNVLWNGSKRYWTSGSWNGKNFNLVPEMRRSFMYNYDFVSNDNESYFTYSVYNTSSSLQITRFVIDTSGQIKLLNRMPPFGWSLFWSKPSNQCEVYAYCGAYGICSERTCSCLPGFEPKMKSYWDLEDYSDGCLRRSRIQCGNNNGDSGQFKPISNVSLPNNQQSVRARNSGECKARCLNNCSCTAFAYDSGGCSIWTGDLLNLNRHAANDSSGRTLYLRLATSEIQIPKQSSRNRKFHIVLFAIITAAVVTPIVACWLYHLRRKRLGNRRGNRSTQENHATSLYYSEKHIRDFMHSGQFREDEKKGIEVPFVALESILAATDNFSEANKLGQGGFGRVYKGKFPGGQEIAIKRLSSGSGQGLKEFKNEVLLIAKLQHRNLVRLLGYCVEGDEKMLIYEYMPNKSLDSFLFDRKKCMLLNWANRFDIVFGLAKGLLYLHHDSRLRIIHRDMKTSNVLLDEEMTPKISDFGLAKIFGGKQMEASTNRVVGTYGYMSPEYALHGLFSIKSDVFSFGVVILEIISGKKNTGFYHSEEALSLLDYAWKLWKENKVLDLIDTTLRESCKENEFLRCFNVGLLCVQDDPNDRPTMSNVVVMLGSESGSLPPPKQPAFVVRRSLSNTAPPGDKPLSRNEITDTLKEGR